MSPLDVAMEDNGQKKSSQRAKATAAKWADQRTYTTSRVGSFHDPFPTGLDHSYRLMTAVCSHFPFSIEVFIWTSDFYSSVYTGCSGQITCLSVYKPS
jgi:hypothetical protein